jgi:UDP-galactopyranose mutase
MKMVARMLEGVEVRLNEDYLADKTKWDALAEKEEKVIFGGRLGEYKYYDMDQVIAAALEKAEGLL